MGLQNFTDGQCSTRCPGKPTFWHATHRMMSTTRHTPPKPPIVYTTHPPHKHLVSTTCLTATLSGRDGYAHGVCENVGHFVVDAPVHFGSFMQKVSVPPQVSGHPTQIFGHDAVVIDAVEGQGGGADVGRAAPSACSGMAKQLPCLSPGFTVPGQGGGVNVGHAVPPVHLGSAKQPPYIFPHLLMKSAQIVGQGFVGDGEGGFVAGFGIADASPIRSANGSASIVAVVW